MISEIQIENREKIVQDNLLLLKLKVQEKRLEDVWRKFEDAGFKPILIKGWATALKYPNPAERIYVDVDLVFSKEEFLRAEEFIAKNTFDLALDLHREARHLDSLEFNQLFANSIFKPCGNVLVRIPCEEDHLRINAVHWLTDGGGYKDRLWDIFYAVENRSEDFDWSKCLDVVIEKRRFWVICVIGIANKYLDLKIDNLPFKDEIKNIPSWVFNALEKEWQDEVRLMPMHMFLNDKQKLWKQIKKRFPPNPIHATVLMNGKFNQTPRIFYQFANILQRILPSWRRISERLGIRKRK